MPGTAVGLYCAVVDRFELLVSTRVLVAHETKAGINHEAGNLRTWVVPLSHCSGGDSFARGKLTVLPASMGEDEDERIGRDADASMDASDIRSRRRPFEVCSASSTNFSWPGAAEERGLR